MSLECHHEMDGASYAYQAPVDLHSYGTAAMQG